MSTTIMGLCWPMQMPPTPKAVLISLADQANDQGACWPSLLGIAERTCFGRTAVIEAVKWLEEQGLLTIHKAGGRNNRYQLNMEKLVRGGACEGAEVIPNPSGRRTGPGGVPVREADGYPSGRRTTTRPGGGLTRPAGGPEPSITINTKEIEPAVLTTTVDNLVEDGLTPETAAEWLAHRKRRKSPLTPMAWGDLKAEVAKAGWEPEAAIRKALRRGWTGFDASWLDEGKGDAKAAGRGEAKAPPGQPPTPPSREAEATQRLLAEQAQHAAQAAGVDVAAQVAAIRARLGRPATAAAGVQ